MRNAPFALFLGGILAYGGLFAWYALDRIDFFNLIDGLNTDDSFYYFKIAQYMAEGKFSTPSTAASRAPRLPPPSGCF